MKIIEKHKNGNIIIGDLPLTSMQFDEELEKLLVGIDMNTRLTFLNRNVKCSVLKVDLDNETSHDLIKNKLGLI